MLTNMSSLIMTSTTDLSDLSTTEAFFMMEIGSGYTDSLNGWHSQHTIGRS